MCNSANSKDGNISFNPPKPAICFGLYDSSWYVNINPLKCFYISQADPISPPLSPPKNKIQSRDREQLNNQNSPLWGLPVRHHGVMGAGKWGSVFHIRFCPTGTLKRVKSDPGEAMKKEGTIINHRGVVALLLDPRKPSKLAGEM